MKIKYENTYENVYSCPCGYCKSYKSDISHGSSAAGGAVFALSYFNVGNKLRYCEKCDSYWFDGNARYFHELPVILRILYCMGWAVLPYFFPVWIVFTRNFDHTILTIIFAPVIFVFGLALQLWFIIWALICNIIAFPFVLIPHIIDAINSKKIEKKEYPELIRFKEEKYRENLYRFLCGLDDWKY